MPQICAMSSPLVHLQQWIAGRFPQLACQLSAMLEDELSGDDPQVDSQQLVAFHHLTLVVLTVVAQQLPARHSILYRQKYSND